MRFALSYEALNTNWTPASAGDVPERAREAERVSLAFDDARAGDEEQGRSVANREARELDRLHGRYPITEAVAPDAAVA